MEHGIEIWTDWGWLYIPARDREQADALQAATVAEGIALSRRVARTAEGFTVMVNTTA